MRSIVGIVLVAAGILTTANLGIPFAIAQPAPTVVRFAAIDVYIDSIEPLAAWQFELTDKSGSMTVVGVENGDSAAYRDAPYYDLDAVSADRADRIVVADYSLAARNDLPVGRTRIATVHVRLIGGQAPDFDLRLIAAGNIDGRAIPAEANLEFDNGRAQ
jgi:hypothetical protein